mgnify:CR=1 FL=1
MRIAYIYDLPVTVSEDWDCEKRFVDMPAMKRINRCDLIDAGGLHADDVLVITQLSQLGQGRESTMIQDRIKGIGATIELRPQPAPVRLKRREGWLVPTTDQLNRIKPLWRSAQPAAYVLQQASEVMGQPINRAWLNRHCENRTEKK